jgi:predicted RNA-binding Zn ribbon-like protein
MRSGSIMPKIRRQTRKPLEDERALRFLNTRPRVNGKLVDLFQCDGDVLQWLEVAGYYYAERLPDPLSDTLLHAARRLRENIRLLVEKRKSGKRGDASMLNGFLIQGPSYTKLIWEFPDYVTMTRMSQNDTAEQLLAPVAQSAADLLVWGEISLVKRCKNKSCSLWFYDRTKTHSRCWCSMAACGNRHKIAAYRKRQLSS